MRWLVLNWMSQRSMFLAAACLHICLWSFLIPTFSPQPSAKQSQMTMPSCWNHEFFQWHPSRWLEVPTILDEQPLVNEAHTLFRGEKCGLWLNFEGISSYSRGEWPIVLLHRTQRARGIPHSIANGVHIDTVMNWPVDIFYQLWGSVQSALLLIRGRMFTPFLFL